MKRDVFYFYRSYLETALKLQPPEQLALFKAIADYALNDNEPELTGVSDIVFTAIRPILDNEKANYLNGKKGGRPRKKEGFSENEKGGVEKSETYNTNTKTNINTEIKKDIRKKVAVAPVRKFIAPTLLEVMAYAADMKYTDFNAEQFYSYYESNGWKVGRNPMKDWKAAIRMWYSKDRPIKQGYDAKHPIGNFKNEYTKIN